MLDRIRRILTRIRHEPILLGAVVAVAAQLGLDDLAAEVGVELTSEWVAGAIGVVVAALRLFTNSRTHTRTVETERDQLHEKVAAATEAADPHPHGAD